MYTSVSSCLFLARNIVFNYDNIASPETREGEVEYLAQYDPSVFTPGLTRETMVFTSDACVFTVQDDVLKVLLVQRAGFPFKGMWVLPGGFIDANETPEQAVLRELEEETSLATTAPKFVCVSSAPWHDPRMKNLISHTFSFFIAEEAHVAGGDDAADAKWYPVMDVLTGVLPVGFDHYHSIQQSILAQFG